MWKNQGKHIQKVKKQVHSWFHDLRICYLFQCFKKKNESKRLFYTSVSLLLCCIQGYCYHLSKFHIYALVYCIGVFGLCGRGRGWGHLGEWHWNMYNIIYKTSRQSRFDARYWMLEAGALGQPRGMVRGGRREEGSGWGTRVYLWWIHVDIWQNQYNIVKLKNKINKKRKITRS